MKFTIPTKFYLDYQTCLLLEKELGREDFIYLINKTKVITIDEEAYAFLNRIVLEHNEKLNDTDEPE